MPELLPIWLAVLVLAATVVVAVVAGRTGVPASVGLVLIGLGVAVIGPGLVPTIPPSLLLAVVLPGLVFEAAFRTDRADLRRTALPILILAVPGVVIVAAIVGAVLVTTTELTLAEGFLVGAMVAATDPAAVLSTFRRVPVPGRLGTTVEMESLINDGTGIVLFTLAIEIVNGGGSLGGSVLAFVVRVAGGAIVGALAGWIAAALVGGIEDHLAELTLTVVLAYGGYLAAEAIGTSGVIATLVAAGTFGARARGRLTARTVEAIDEVWEFAAFLLTAGVFLLIGLEIAPRALAQAAGTIAWGVAAILVARAIVVFGVLGAGFALFGRLGRRPSDDPDGRSFPPSWLVVLFWAGLRGAVSVALALSLPMGLPNRELIQGLAYGIVLFTLVVQGTTAAWIVRRSGAAVAPGTA